MMQHAASHSPKAALSIVPQVIDCIDGLKANAQEVHSRGRIDRLHSVSICRQVVHAIRNEQMGKRWPQLWRLSQRQLVALAQLRKVPQPCLIQPFNCGLLQKHGLNINVSADRLSKLSRMSRRPRRWPQLWTQSQRQLAASVQLRKMPQPCLAQPFRLQRPSVA